jgi:hypothetical protein
MVSRLAPLQLPAARHKKTGAAIGTGFATAD